MSFLPSQQMGFEIACCISNINKRVNKQIIFRTLTIHHLGESQWQHVEEYQSNKSMRIT